MDQSWSRDSQIAVRKHPKRDKERNSLVLRLLMQSGYVCRFYIIHDLTIVIIFGFYYRGNEKGGIEITPGFLVGKQTMENAMTS